MSRGVIPDSGAEGAVCGAILLFACWGLDKVTGLFSRLREIDIDWNAFIPSGVINFFSMPFHFWFIISLAIVFVFSFCISIISSLGGKKEILLVPVIFSIPLLIIWFFIGLIYGIKIYFSKIGIIPSVGLGLKTMWNSSIGFFSAASEGISWIHLTIGFMMLGLMLLFVLTIICQLICTGLDRIGISYLTEENVTTDMKEFAIVSFVCIITLWTIFSIGGIIWIFAT